MNPSFRARNESNVAQHSAGSHAGSPRRDPDTGVSRQLFIHDINLALENDEMLKAKHPTQGLQPDEVTAILREMERLAPLCTDEASSLTLAAHLSDRVRAALTDAVLGAGLTVIDHDAQDVPASAFHFHEPEMKRPPADEEAPRVEAKLKRPRSGEDEHPIGPEAGLPAPTNRARMASSSSSGSLSITHDLPAALGHGNAAPVTSFMNGLTGLGLSHDDVYELIAGESLGRCWYIRDWGRHDAVNAYADSLTRLREQNLISDYQLDQLERATRAVGASGRRT